MRLTAPQLDVLIQRLEESDKAISGRVPRDAVLAAQTDIFLRLGIKDRDRMEQGRAEMGEALASFKEDMVGMIAKFQAGQLTSSEALAEWKAMTGKYYVDMFRAGAKSVGNPYFDELTTKDMAFINKARRFEQTFFKGFLDDMQNPDFHPVHPFLDRAEYYADSAKAQFYNGMVAGAGKEVEIDWVLGVAEHCDDCIMISSGSPYTWETLPTTPQAGDTECLFNCKCHLEIKMAREQEGMFTGGPAAAGPETTKPSDTPGRYASVWDAQGEPMTGEILDAADDLYQEMYKARQMIYATDGDEKQDWITRRQNINRELVQRFEDMGYRVTPNVAVKDLIDVARDALNEAPEGVIKDTSQIMVGAEVIFVRANYATKGVVEMKGADVHIETADGGDYKYDHDTDILFLINNPGQNESLIEGGPGSGRYPKGSGGQKDVPVTSVLHGTSYERLQSILKNGLVPQEQHNWDQNFYKAERSGVVFVTRDFMAAARYAESAQTNSPGSVPVVLKLSIPKSVKLQRDAAGDTSDRYTSEHIRPEWIKTVYIQTSTEPRVFTWKTVPADSFHESDAGNETVYAALVLMRGEKQNEYSPNQARDYHGRWSSGGGVENDYGLDIGKLYADTVAARDVAVSGDAKEVAHKYFEEAAKTEPQISADILAIKDACGVEMDRFEYRLKRESSIGSKIVREMQVTDPDKQDYEEAASHIRDTIRYTVVGKDEGFADSIEKFHDALLAKGYEYVVHKNNFYEGGAIRNINAKYMSKATGKIFEIQYYSKAGVAYAEKNHKYYEVQRDSKDDALNRKFEAIMVHNWKPYRMPADGKHVGDTWDKRGHR